MAYIVVNTSNHSNVYDFVGFSADASRPQDNVDLLAAGLPSPPVSEPATLEMSEDAMLVRAARNGDRGAFGRLYGLYARMVHGILLAKVPRAEVDDLVQDVFMMALRRLSSLKKDGSFGAWLAAITRNLANDYHRRSAPEDQLAEDTNGDMASAISGGDDGESAVILDAVKSLPDAYRETLILRLVEGMTGPEIATRTGMTHGSVRVNLHRGMQQLRAKLSSCASRNGAEQEAP